MGNNKNYYKTKTMLNSYLLWKAEIIDLEIENRMLENYDIGAMQYGESIGKTYKVTSGVESKLMLNQSKIDTNNEIIKISRYNVARIDNAIKILQNKFEKEVIEQKFLKARTNSWKDVASNLNSQSETCRQASIRAISKIAKFLFDK